MIFSYLEVISGELQHVTQDIADDLRFSLDEHILIVQRLDDLWFYLKEQKMPSAEPLPVWIHILLD